MPLKWPSNIPVRNATDMSPELLYVIWSEQHGAWWCPNKRGYTRQLTAAGRYSKAAAEEIVTEANRYVYFPERTWNEIAIRDPIQLRAVIQP
jgi:hypothetical protein